jgi:hypothetical protein
MRPWTACVFLVLLLPAVSLALEVRTDFRKDPSTGRMVGFAESVFPQEPAQIWGVLTQAVHGKLSDRTKACGGVKDTLVRALMVGGNQAQATLMPVSKDREDRLRSQLESALINPVARVDLGAREERFVYRKISVPIPFTSDRWFLARELHDAKSGLASGQFTLEIEGLAGNVRHYQSTWKMKPAPAGGALVRVDITSDMGIPVPGFLVGLGAKELETSMKRLAGMVEAAGARKP